MVSGGEDSRSGSGKELRRVWLVVVRIAGEAVGRN